MTRRNISPDVFSADFEVLDILLWPSEYNCAQWAHDYLYFSTSYAEKEGLLVSFKKCVLLNKILYNLLEKKNSIQPTREKG